MNLPRLLNNYQEAQLERVAIGPRRELTLFIHLDPVWNASILENAVVRFGSIVNFPEVERFFSGLRCDPRRDFIAEVYRLERAQPDSWLLDLEGYGAICILSARCTEQKR